MQTKEDILLKKQEKTVIMISLFININYPLEVIDVLAANEDLLSTTQLITFHRITQAETLEVLNLSMIRDCTLKKGSIILKLKPIFPMMHKVFLIERPAKELQIIWSQASSSSSMFKQRQLTWKLSYLILPVLQKMHHAELDIRQDGERDMVQQNNLSIVRNYMAEPENKSVVCNYSYVYIMSNLEIQQADEILILQFLKKGFSITTGELL